MLKKQHNREKLMQKLLKLLAFAVQCSNRLNDAQFINILSETMNKDNLRWAINNCYRRYWDQNSFDCKFVKVIGTLGPKYESHLGNAGIFKD